MEMRPQLDTSHDWFLPGINPQESLEQGLNKVVLQETMRLRFAQALQIKLCHHRGPSPDSISELRRQIRHLADTLDFRLPLLSPDRRGAWFRESSLSGLGPLAGTAILTIPVLPTVDFKQLLKVKAELEAFWKNPSPTIQPFHDRSPSLWGSLMALRLQWTELTQVVVDTKTYSLLDLAQSMPDALISPALRIFIHHVSQALQAAQGDLSDCYQRLKAATLTLFAQIERDPAAQKPKTSSTASQKAWDGQTSPQDAYNQFRRNTDDIRNRFKERRETTSPATSRETESSALSFLGFTQRPNANTLRKRYWELARQLHPDNPKGNEDAFKELNHHYHFLMERLQT